MATTEQDPVSVPGTDADRSYAELERRARELAEVIVETGNVEKLAEVLAYLGKLTVEQQALAEYLLLQTENGLMALQVMEEMALVVEELAPAAVRNTLLAISGTAADFQDGYNADYAAWLKQEERVLETEILAISLSEEGQAAINDTIRRSVG